MLVGTVIRLTRNLLPIRIVRLKKPPDAGPKIGDIAIPKEIYAILALDFRVLVVSRTTALAITIKHVDAACTALKSINLSI